MHCNKRRSRVRLHSKAFDGDQVSGLLMLFQLGLMPQTGIEIQTVRRFDSEDLVAYHVIHFAFKHVDEPPAGVIDG